MKDNIKKSNKIYLCCECKETIKKGDLYERIGAYKTCMLCVKIRNKFFSIISHGELWKNLEKVAYGLTLQEFDGLNIQAVHKIDQYFKNEYFTPNGKRDV